MFCKYTFLLATSLALGSLSATEEAGFTSLFDGESLSGWTKVDGSAVEAGWVVQEGTIHRSGKGGDIYSAKEYANFDFRFDWKISPGGNSGVKYRMTEYNKKLLGPEYQVLDDDKHPDAKVTVKRHAAALYDIKATTPDKPIRPVGEWNEGRIVANGTRMEHWLNGEKVMEVDTTSPEWKNLLAASKFKNIAGYCEAPAGRLQLQDHGDLVWFRNLRIKELP